MTNFYQIPLLRIPRIQSKVGRIYQSTRRAEAAMVSFYPVLYEAVVSALKYETVYLRRMRSFQDLNHRLSPIVIKNLANAPEASKKYEDCFSSEIFAYEYAKTQFYQVLEEASFASFLRLICEIASIVKCADMNIRRSPVYTESDINGLRWRYPDSASILPQLERIWVYLRNESESVLIRAATAHVLIASLHPFMDGNGRIARVIFNLVLAKSMRVYFPLNELFNVIPFGYLIRTRLLYSDENWLDIYCYFANLIFAYYRCQRKILCGDL